MNARIKLAFVGPMIGRSPGYVTTQGEILADYFSSAGYPVVCVSSSPNRYYRPWDIAKTLISRRDQIDIMCLQVYGGPSFLVEDMSSWLGRQLGHRIIMTLRGGAMPEFMARYPKWSQRVLKRGDVITVPSPFLARAAERHGFRAQVIPNVVDISRYDYKPRSVIRPRLFWMRSFHPVYNPLMAIRVLALIRSERPDATLVMAGQDKGQERQVRRLAQEMGLNGAVRFPGFLTMDAKMSEGEHADIYINTNRVDNTPVAVLEACAMGLPVVATSVGGLPDLLTDEETGLLVPDDDIEAMAQAIFRLLREPELVSRLSSNGRQIAQDSSWDRLGQTWEGVFESLMTQQARNPGDSL